MRRKSLSSREYFGATQAEIRKMKGGDSVHRNEASKQIKLARFYLEKIRFAIDTVPWHRLDPKYLRYLVHRFQTVRYGAYRTMGVTAWKEWLKAMDEIWAEVK